MIRVYSASDFPMLVTPAQKKQASYPVSLSSPSFRSRNSGTMYSFNFGCDVPVGLRLTLNTSDISGLDKHSKNTPSPTIPVVPVMMTLICFIYGYCRERPPCNGVADNNISKLGNLLQHDHSLRSDNSPCKDRQRLNATAYVGLNKLLRL